jgi:hypothetical protein
MQRNGQPFAKDSLTNGRIGRLNQVEGDGIQFAIDSSGSPNGGQSYGAVASSFCVP